MHSKYIQKNYNEKKTKETVSGNDVLHKGKHPKNSEDKDIVDKKAEMNAAEVSSAIVVIIAVFFAFRSILALADRNNYGGMVEFGDLVNDVPLIVHAIYFYVVIGLIIFIVTSMLYPRKKFHYTKTRIFWIAIIFISSVSVVVLKFIGNYYNIDKLTDLSSVILLLDIPIAIMFLFITSKEYFTPLAFFIASFATIALFGSLLVSFILFDNESLPKYDIYTQTKGEEIQYINRYGDMLVIISKDGTQKVMPLSYFKGAVMKDNATDNSTKNLRQPPHQ